MKNLELSLDQKIFIEKNRFSMSMNDMQKELQVGFYKIRKYMIDNNLQVDKKTIQEIRLRNKPPVKNTTSEVGYVRPKYISDFWNKDINPITMHRSN